MSHFSITFSSFNSFVGVHARNAACEGAAGFVQRTKCAAFGHGPAPGRAAECEGAYVCL